MRRSNDREERNERNERGGRGGRNDRGERRGGRRREGGFRKDGGSGRDRDGQEYPSRYNNGNGGSRYGSSDNGNGNGGSRFGSRRSDYGPVLARELDSTYREKVNRNYANSIFVGNLTYDCTPEDLRQHFGDVGEVVRADIITSRGHHRGMGTVEYTNPHDVDEAIRRYDSSSFMERPIFVRQDNPPPEARNDRNDRRDRSERSDRPKRNERNGSTPQGYELLIDNLPYDINWQALKDMFKECGAVMRADVDMDDRRRSTGRGNVTMANKADFDTALRMYNNYNIDGQVLSVRPGRLPPSAQNDTPAASTSTASATATETAASSGFSTDGYSANGERSRFVYCSNLPETTDRNDLYDLFETIGKLNNAELRVDAQGEPTGIAVIEYADNADADVCIERLNNYNYGDCDLHISYAKR